MNNEEANAISKSSYMAGVLDERSQWYQKINEKIEELEKEADYRAMDNPTGRIHFHKEPVDYQIEILKELIGKEE